MKKKISGTTRIAQPIREMAGATFMVLGSVILVITFIPLLNPAQYKYYSTGEELEITRYLLGSLLSIFVMYVAYQLSRRKYVLVDKSESDIDKDPIFEDDLDSQ